MQCLGGSAFAQAIGAVGTLRLGSAPSAQSCAQTLSAGANVASAVSSASAGSTICLNNGNYSGFTLSGVSKNPRVTIRAVNPRGASITSTLTLTGGTNGLTFDGVNLGTVWVTGSTTRELTFYNFASSGAITIENITSATPNILFDTFDQIGFNLTQANPAGIAVGGTRSSPIATIRNANIDGGCADGIRIATPVIVENSRIKNKQVGSCPNDPHTDAMQFYGGPFAGTIIRGNYFYRNVQALAAYDGIDGVLIENNILDPGPDGERRSCQIELYSDANSIIRHNTVVYRGSGYGHICLDRKSTDDAGFGTIVVDNIANSIQANNGSTYAKRTANLVRTGAASGDIAGAPVYIGGSTPTTIDGFQLAATSLGRGAASAPAGSDVGVIIGASTPPP